MKEPYRLISFQGGDSSLLALSLEIRGEVFIKEQGIDAELENDDQDAIARHYLVFQGDTPIATARWRPTQKGIKLERYAVLPSWRKKGIGRIILQRMLQDLAGKDATVYLHAQSGVVDFYYKSGFRISGTEFWEAGISHYLMILEKRN